MELIIDKDQQQTYMSNKRNLAKLVPKTKGRMHPFGVYLGKRKQESGVS